eukprot:gene20141-26873_t
MADRSSSTSNRLSEAERSRQAEQDRSTFLQGRVDHLQGQVDLLQEKLHVQVSAADRREEEYQLKIRSLQQKLGELTILNDRMQLEMTTARQEVGIP